MEGKETRNRRSRACAVLESAHSNALAAGNKDVLTPVFSARRAARARVPAAHQRVRRARLRGARLEAPVSCAEFYDDLRRTMKVCLNPQNYNNLTLNPIIIHKISLNPVSYKNMTLPTILVV